MLRLEFDCQKAHHQLRPLSLYGTPLAYSVPFAPMKLIALIGIAGGGTVYGGSGGGRGGGDDTWQHSIQQRLPSPLPQFWRLLVQEQSHPSTGVGDSSSSMPSHRNSMVAARRARLARARAVLFTPSMTPSTKSMTKKRCSMHFILT